MLVAAGIFALIGGSAYLAHHNNEKTRASDALWAALNRRPAPPVGYSTEIPSPTPNRSEASLLSPIQVNTIDGSLNIPAGTRVRLLPDEKSKPGTVKINYQGYTLSIPSAAVASVSE